MRKMSAIVLIVAGLGVAVANAQSSPSGAPARTVKAVQPGLMEVTGPRVHEAAAAGIQKITATTSKIEVHSPWGNINFGWPKDVKPVAFTINHAKAANTVTVSAPGFNEANKADYKAAFEAVVPMAISKASAQKEGRTKG
jgi:hypothetical protein